MKRLFSKVAAGFLCSFMLASLMPAIAQTKPAVTRPPVTLKEGDNAPPIVAARWFKGEPVTSFKPGQVYVIEFWATWCGPCRMAMPHLSELARKYKGKATFVGFNIKEAAPGKDGDYITRVANFVKNLGDGMDYAVAADVREGTMNNTWMIPAGKFGIPSTFVIDRQGKISWIGHPMELQDVLPLVLEERFDDNARKELAAANKEKYARLNKMRTAFDSLMKSGNTEQAIAIADELIARVSYDKIVYEIAKYEYLKSKSDPGAMDYAVDIKNKYANDPLGLQFFAVALSKRESREEKKLAVKIMEQAMTRLAPDDYNGYGTLASIYFSSGEVKKAVTAQEKVMAILSDTSLSNYRQSTIDQAREDLQKYKSGK